MLIDIRYQHLPIFEGSMLHRLLRGDGLKHSQLREKLILEIFRDNFEKRKYKQKHGNKSVNYTVIPNKLGFHARADVRKSLRKAVEASKLHTIRN